MARKNIEDLFPTPTKVDENIFKPIRGEYVSTVNNTVSPNGKITYIIQGGTEDHCYCDFNIDGEYESIQLTIGNNEIDTVEYRFQNILKTIYGMDTIPIYLFKQGIPHSEYQHIAIVINGCLGDVNISYNIHKINYNNIRDTGCACEFPMVRCSCRIIGHSGDVSSFNLPILYFVNEKNDIKRFIVQRTDYPFESYELHDMQVIEPEKHQVNTAKPENLNLGYLNMSRVDYAKFVFEKVEFRMIMAINMNVFRFDGVASGIVHVQ